MDLVNYKQLSTAEKILLVEEIWDSISEDKIALTKNQKELLDERLISLKTTTKRTSWEEIKKKVRAKKSPNWSEHPLRPTPFVCTMIYLIQ